MFGMRSKMTNPSSIKIMIVDVDEPDAIEELSSYLSELKPSGNKLLEGKYKYNQNEDMVKRSIWGTSTASNWIKFNI